MTERTPDGSALGFPDIEMPAPETDPLSDEYTEVPAEAPAPPEEAQAPEFDELDEEFQAPEAEAEAEEVPPPVAEEAPAPHLYAGRYLEVGQLEKGYTELQGEYTRERQARLELENRQKQVEEILQGLVPVLEQQLMAQDPETAEQYRQQQAIQQQAKAIAEQEVAPLREQLAFQQQQAEVNALVAEFRRRHPDAAPGTEVDQMVVSTVQDLGLNAANLDSLEVAYEAGKDRYLRSVLKANPVLVESNEGIAYARIQARLLEGLSGQPPTPQRQPSPQAPAAYVETGEGGAPAKAASQPAHDEFDEALDLYAKERRSPLFGS